MGRLPVRNLFLVWVLISPAAVMAHSLYLKVGVEEAQVSVDGFPVGRTDQYGVFFLEPVSAGKHVLMITKEQYRNFVDTIIVPEGLTYNHVRDLEPLRVIMINDRTGLEDERVTGPYTIQVGAFRSLENAGRVALLLKENSFEPRLETAEVSGLGLVHRVRVSLFSSLEEARSVARKILPLHGDDIWIVGLDGRDWAVQFSALSSRDRAEKLAASLSEPDVYSWVETTPEGIFRVKLGYWASRAEAEKAASRLGARLGVSPMAVQVR